MELFARRFGNWIIRMQTNWVSCEYKQKKFEWFHKELWIRRICIKQMERNAKSLRNSFCLVWNFTLVNLTAKTQTMIMTCFITLLTQLMHKPFVEFPLTHDEQPNLR